MATVVTYNGVELHNVVTRDWTEEAVYDSSGTDLLYRRIHMRFQGIAHRAGSGDSPGSGGSWGPAYIIGPNTNPGESTPQIFNAIRPRLLMPRQRLTVAMNGQVVLDVVAAVSGESADTRDLDGGPRPRSATLAHVVGDQVFRIDFTIDCTIDANNSPIDGAAQGNGSVVINNRWAIAESCGDNFAITRTIRGHLRLSRWIVNSQDFRKVVVPPLEQSFKRERMDFQVSDNGLDCEYTIVDRQVHVAAPWPACKLEATYTESSNDQQTCWADMVVALEGPISAGVYLMMVRATQIIDTRLRLIESKQSGDKHNYTVEAYSLTEHIGERNAIEAHVRIRHTKESSTPDGIAALYRESFGQAVGGQERILDLSAYPNGGHAYNVWTSQAPELFGYMPGTDTPRQAAFLYALGCYYQDPWHPQAMGGNLNGSNGTTGSANPAPIMSVSPNNGYQPTEAPNKLSTETKEATYTFTRVATRYFSHGCNVQLPIASEESDADADTCVVVSLARPQFRREVHYDHERVGMWPEIVGASTGYTDGDGMNGTLLKSWDRILPPGLSADKTQPIHRIEGYRLYAINRLPKPGEKIRTGILPSTSYTSEDTSVALDTLMTERLQA